MRAQAHLPVHTAPELCLSVPAALGQRGEKEEAVGLDARARRGSPRKRPFRSHCGFSASEDIRPHIIIIMELRPSPEDTERAESHVTPSFLPSFHPSSSARTRPSVDRVPSLWSQYIQANASRQHRGTFICLVSTCWCVPSVQSLVRKTKRASSAHHADVSCRHIEMCHIST